MIFTVSIPARVLWADSNSLNAKWDKTSTIYCVAFLEAVGFAKGIGINSESTITYE